MITVWLANIAPNGIGDRPDAGDRRQDILILHVKNMFRWFRRMLLPRQTTIDGCAYRETLLK
jgi:hypothetical protein